MTDLNSMLKSNFVESNDNSDDGDATSPSDQDTNVDSGIDSNAQSNAQINAQSSDDEISIDLKDPIDSLLDAPAPVVEYDFADLESSIDKDVISVYKDAIKDSGLSNDKAKEVASKVSAALTEQSQKQFQSLVSDWKSKSSNDKEINNPNSLTQIKTVVNKYGDSEFKELLSQTGLINHPSFLKFLKRVGDGVVSTSLPVGKSVAPEQKTQPAIYNLIDKQYAGR